MINHDDILFLGTPYFKLLRHDIMQLDVYSFWRGLCCGDSARFSNIFETSVLKPLNIFCILLTGKIREKTGNHVCTF